MLPAVILAITVFTQALFSGLYVASLVHCLRWLLFSDEGWKRREKIDWIMLKAALLFPAFLAVNIAFVFNKQLYHLIGTLPWNYARDIVLGGSRDAVYFLLEAVLIYRCWIVYGQSWRIIVLPTLFWLGEITFAAVAIYGFRNPVYPKDPTVIMHQKLQHRLSRFKSTSIACGVAITIYTTFAIIHRIARTAEASKSRTRRINYMGRIIAESGLLYTITTLVNLIPLAIQAASPSDTSILAANVTEAINVPMSGIAFNLIFIWVYSEQTQSRDGSILSKELDDLPELPRFNQFGTTGEDQSKLTRGREINELMEVNKLSDSARDDKY